MSRCRVDGVEVMTRSPVSTSTQREGTIGRGDGAARHGVSSDAIDAKTGAIEESARDAAIRTFS